MFKKILIVSLIALALGIVAVGAVIRTLDKTGATTATQVTGGGYGQGRGNMNTTAPSDGTTYNGGQGPRWGQLDTNTAQPLQTTTATGTVASVDAITLAIKTADGKELIVENRPWSFALENKFTAKIGDQIRLTGFDQAGIFETTKIENLTTGTNVQLRDQYGRPGWSGKGRGNGG